MNFKKRIERLCTGINEARKERLVKKLDDEEPVAEAIVSDSFEPSVWNLESSPLRSSEVDQLGWQDIYPVVQERFVLTERDQQDLYRFLRNRDNDLSHFPFGLFRDRWEAWIKDKFYLAQSRIIIEGAPKSSGLFVNFHFIPGDFIFYEGTIRCFDLGVDLPQDMLDEIADGYTLHVHSTDFECYIIGDKGILIF
jgi:hypothetical protein